MTCAPAARPTLVERIAVAGVVVVIAATARAIFWR